MYLVKSPRLLKWLYPNLIWGAKPGARCIYLTFDDGPIPIVTPFVLNILKQYNAKATFFCIGDNISMHPGLFNEIISDGHAIGNHTFNHLKGWDTDSQAYLDNFLQCDVLTQSNLFRPPYGRVKREQIKLLKQARADLKIIMWDVLSGDFDVSLKPDDCLKNVLKHTGDGSIVVFHDSLKAFDRLKYTLPLALEQWSKEGYKFLPLVPGLL